MLAENAWPAASKAVETLITEAEEAERNLLIGTCERADVTITEMKMQFEKLREEGDRYYEQRDDLFGPRPSRGQGLAERERDT